MAPIGAYRHAANNLLAAKRPRGAGCWQPRGAGDRCLYSRRRRPSMTAVTTSTLGGIRPFSLGFLPPLGRTRFALRQPA